MSEDELVQKVLGDYSTADLVAWLQYNSDSLKYWQNDEMFKGEDSEYFRNRQTKIFNLQRLGVAIDMVLNKRRDYLIELLGDFRTN